MNIKRFVMASVLIVGLCLFTGCKCACKNKDGNACVLTEELACAQTVSETTMP